MQELFLQPLDVGECPLMVLIGLSFVGGMTFEMIRVCDLDRVDICMYGYEVGDNKYMLPAVLVGWITLFW